MTLEELDLHLDAITQLRSAREQLQSVKDFILRAQTYDGMPHGTGNTDKVAAIAIKISEEEERVARYAEIVKQSEKQVGEFVNGIEDPRTNMIFYLRFMCGYDWGTVAEAVGGRNTEDAVKSVCYRYLRQLQAEQAP